MAGRNFSGKVTEGLIDGNLRHTSEGSEPEVCQKEARTEENLRGFGIPKGCKTGSIGAARGSQGYAKAPLVPAALLIIFCISACLSCLTLPTSGL